MDLILSCRQSCPPLKRLSTGILALHQMVMSERIQANLTPSWLFACQLAEAMGLQAARILQHQDATFEDTHFGLHPQSHGLSRVRVKPPRVVMEAPFLYARWAGLCKCVCKHVIWVTLVTVHPMAMS
ncbi:unnamed protein product [Protopolystoma xenopodis]|uniref:Uncharacterized protein n=1 Tax=Protopolystoma xenopodis TaxID=117903 RepID=A0A448XB06_9PLAT|nr:unnamed protein product [Protopolystoma xenopodis]